MTQISDQITVAAAGTAVQGPSVVGNVWGLRPHPDNTDTIWVGNDGEDDVDEDTGFPLPAGSSGLVVRGSTLSNFWFDAAVSGEKVCWIKLE